METKRIPVPKFFAVPAGTRAAECRSCKATIYFVETDSGKKMPVDCEVMGGSEPSDREAGSGVSHFGTCDNPSRFRKPREQSPL